VRPGFAGSIDSLFQATSKHHVAGGARGGGLPPLRCTHPEPELIIRPRKAALLVLSGVARVRVDMHVHSSASFDCSVPPADVARRLRSYGIDPVFLTDHDSIGGASQLRRQGTLATVTGEEVSTRDGDLIGLFLAEVVEPGLSAAQTVDRIKEQGGLVYVPHPFDRRRRALELDALERVRGRVDIVEVFNGRSSAGANRLAEDACATIGAVPGAGSDAHSLSELGRVYVEMDGFQGPDDFLAGLEQGRIVRDPPRWLMRLGSLATTRPPARALPAPLRGGSGRG
jgi:predicted metal-dependent phosphoesterase TrpH